MVETATPGDAASFREAALRHLSRYAATQAGLVRVLDRRIGRWSRQALTSGDPPEQVAEQAAQARIVVRGVVASLAAIGAVDDAAFAGSRARSLTRGGRSRRAASAHLAQRGVAAELVEAALPRDDAVELGAAVLQARRRRLGPFGAAPSDEADEAVHQAARQRALATLARAGFSRDIAEQALDIDRDEAESIILRLRQP